MSAVTAIADELHEIVLGHSPVYATQLGIPGHDDRLTDHSEAADRACSAAIADVADRARALDVDGLSDTDRITRTIVIQQADTQIAWFAARWVEFTVSDLIRTPVPGTLLDLATLTLTTAAQGEDYLRRLGRLPAFLDTIADRHRIGIAAGRLPVAHLVRCAVDQLDRQLATVHTLSRRPTDAAPDFAARCDAVVSDTVAPALAAYRDTLRTDVLPHGRDEEHAGLCWLPDGDRTYAAAVRAHTTTDRTPDDLHRTGLDVIAGLADEYVRLGERVFGTDDIQRIFARLRDDPDLRCTDGAQMLDAARAAVHRAEKVAPRWFRTVPSTACVVAPYPAAVSPNTPPAYLPGAMDGSRPGTYFVNTHRPTETVRYKAEVTAFHEGVPGHHFESTTRRERTDLPVLRRTAALSAFGEGWALYTERLADEMGLYSTDLDRLGMLAMDSMRAGRLVVDTGLHAHGWSRQQAVNYLRDNTPMAPAEIESEVDRYLSEPGQALAYMVGRLEIQRLRDKAEHTLGDRFDIQDFHETVLSEGRLPLATLAEVVTTWLAHH